VGSKVVSVLRIGRLSTERKWSVGRIYHRHSITIESFVPYNWRILVSEKVIFLIQVYISNKNIMLSSVAKHSWSV
jgi:hypothetical protein